MQKMLMLVRISFAHFVAYKLNWWPAGVGDDRYSPMDPPLC